MQNFCSGTLSIPYSLSDDDDDDDGDDDDDDPSINGGVSSLFIADLTSALAFVELAFIELALAFASVTMPS